MGVLLIVLIGVAFAAVFPLGVLWALNTLFALDLAFTLTNWFAALLLTAVFSFSTHGRGT